MNTRLAWLGALGVGAGLMFLFDPQAGAVRRRWLLTLASRFAGGTGSGARAPRPRRVEAVDDETLTERIKSALRHAVSHPKAIDVWVVDGHVTLSGPVLEREIPALRRAIERVGGVRGVEERLDTEIHPGSVAGLRGDE